MATNTNSLRAVETAERRLVKAELTGEPAGGVNVDHFACPIRRRIVETLRLLAREDLKAGSDHGDAARKNAAQVLKWLNADPAVKAELRACRSLSADRTGCAAATVAVAARRRDLESRIRTAETLSAEVMASIKGLGSPAALANPIGSIMRVDMTAATARDLVAAIETIGSAFAGEVSRRNRRPA